MGYKLKYFNGFAPLNNYFYIESEIEQSPQNFYDEYRKISY
jgi:hypothetical protein